MKQQNLPLKKQKFKWNVWLSTDPGQKELLFVSGIIAYTETQAEFLAAKDKHVKYYEEGSFAKKLGPVP